MNSRTTKKGRNSKFHLNLLIYFIDKSFIKIILKFIFQLFEIAFWAFLPSEVYDK